MLAWQQGTDPEPKGQGSRWPCPDLSLTSRGGPTEASLGLHLVGGGRPQENPAGPGPPRPVLRGHLRGIREGVRGSDTGFAPTCPVIPQALFQSPHAFADKSSSFPFSSSTSSFCSTQRLRPARRDPAPQQAEGVRLGPRSGDGETGDQSPSLSRAVLRQVGQDLVDKQ